MRAEEFRLAAHLFAQALHVGAAGHAVRDNDAGVPAGLNFIQQAQDEIAADIFLAGICRIEVGKGAAVIAKRDVTDAVVKEVVGRGGCQLLKRGDRDGILRMQQLVDGAGRRVDFRCGHQHTARLGLMEYAHAGGRLQHVAGISAVELHDLPDALSNRLRRIVFAFRPADPALPGIARQHLPLRVRQRLSRLQRIQQVKRGLVRRPAQRIERLAGHFLHAELNRRPLNAERFQIPHQFRDVAARHYALYQRIVCYCIHDAKPLTHIE